MNRAFLDKIKDIIQKAYNRYRVYQIKQSTKKGYKDFIKSCGKIKQPDPGNYIEYWNRLSSFVDPTGYQIYYTLHGVEDIQIVPKEVYYALIEPCLNDYTMSKACKDKNIYDRLLNKDAFPITYLRNMNGVYYDRDYKILSAQQTRDILKVLPKDSEKVMLKPSLITGRRNNVRIVDFIRDSLTLEYLNEKYHHDFLIQEYIEQNKYFDQFGTSNTIRVCTYRSIADNSIFIHDARIGFNSGTGADRSQYIDDHVAINESGELGSFSLSRNWRTSKSAPNNTIPFSAMKSIPKFDEVKKVATEIALLYPYHRRLGLDMIIDKMGKLYIYEINVGLLGIAISQYLGGTLFKEYTEEVIEYCNRNKSNIRFPFTQ
jgi:hypothetical protein